MSDEKRNISDINDQKTIDRTEQAALDQMAEQQAFSEEIRRRLAEPDSGKPTLEEFKVMVYKDREKRRKKRNALVACLVAAFIVGFLTFDDLVPEVGADKNPKKTIQTEDGVIIEDGGWGSVAEEGEQLTITNWKDVKLIKETYSQLMIPQYIPNGYGFDKLVIEGIAENDIACKYVFINERQNSIEIDIVIIEGGAVTSGINGFDKKQNCKNGTIYFQEKNKKAIIHFDDGAVVSIWHDISEGELIRIIDSIE